METGELFKLIPREKLDYLFAHSDAAAELDPSFLGFEEIYRDVLRYVPKDKVVLDLGCAYATQSWYFRDHARYIGVDDWANSDSVIHTDNSEFYFMRIQEFLKDMFPGLGLDVKDVFAVCSFVPDKEAQQMVAEMFPYCRVYYPNGIDVTKKPGIDVILEGDNFMDEKLVDIFDIEYDSEGYLHFHVLADGYALEGLYRLYDPANGPDMTLVSIDYGYMHPIIERQWSRIEEALYDASLNRYYDILDKSEAFKEKVIKAMEAAGYTYDVLESYEGWETFYGEGGVRMGFDRLREAAEWLEGVVFDDPEISGAVGKILHPERQEDLGSIEAMIGDAKERCVDSVAGENKTQEHVKD